MSHKGLAYVNNKFLPLSEAAISVTDLAVQRGYGVSEVFRTYNSQPLAVRSHFQRLARSLKLLRIPKKFTDRALDKIISSGIKRFKGEVMVKILVTGGPGKALKPLGRPSLVVIFTPYHAIPQVWFQNGIALAALTYHPFVPEAKTTNYLQSVLAQFEAEDRGFQEAMFRQGKELTEGTTFSFAIIRGRTLITRQAGVLSGTTMELVLRLARKVGLRVLRRPIHYDELKKADEAFSTSVTREVLPIIRVDKITIGSGKPGKYARMLLEELRQYATKNKKIKIS